MNFSMQSPACVRQTFAEDEPFIPIKTELVGCGVIDCTCGVHEHYPTRELHHEAFLAHLRAHAADFAESGVDINELLERG